MQFKIKREVAERLLDAAEAIGKVESAVLIASKGFVTLSLCNQNEIFEVDCVAEVAVEGRALFPLAKLKGICSDVDQQTLTIKLASTDKGGLYLRVGGDSKTSPLNSALGTSIPEFDPPKWKEPQDEIPIEVAALRALLGRVQGALIPGWKPEFDSIRLEFSIGSVDAVAVSNEKIATATYENDDIQPFAERTQILIPARSLDTLNKVLSKVEGTIFLGLDSDRFAFEVNEPGSTVRYSTPAQAKGPPEVRPLFSTEGLFSARVSANVLKNAIGSVALGVGREGFVTVKFMDSAIRLRSSESDQFVKEIPADYNRPPGEVKQGFKLEYLLTAIGKAKELSIYFGENKPTILVHGDEFQTQFLLAPARV